MAQARFIPGSSWRSVGYHQMTVSTSQVDLTDSSTYTIPPEAMVVRLQPEGANLRYGHTTLVAATTGNIIYTGDVEYVPGVLSSIKMVREAGTDVTLNCNYYGFWH